MSVTIDDDSEYGFTPLPAESRRIGSQKLADVEFANYVSLTANTVEGAKLLDKLEIAAQSVGLVMNCSKAKFMTLNIPEEESSLVGSYGNQLEKVNDFVPLGAWTATAERDQGPRVRKAKAWAGCHKLKKIWKLGLRRGVKIFVLVATVESILLYGSESWTLN